MPDTNIADGVSVKEARQLGRALGVDFARVDFDEFRRGVAVEREHADVTSDPLDTARIALAHLRELPDYYTRLAKMEDTNMTDKKKVVALVKAALEELNAAAPAAKKPPGAANEPILVALMLKANAKMPKRTGGDPYMGTMNKQPLAFFVKKHIYKRGGGYLTVIRGAGGGISLKAVELLMATFKKVSGMDVELLGFNNGSPAYKGKRLENSTARDTAYVKITGKLPKSAGNVPTGPITQKVAQKTGGGGKPALRPLTPDIVAAGGPLMQAKALAKKDGGGQARGFLGIWKDMVGSSKRAAKLESAEPKMCLAVLNLCRRGQFYQAQEELVHIGLPGEEV